MVKIESTVRQIAAPQEAVYQKLSDPGNMAALRDRLPEDKAQSLEFDHDSIAVATPMGRVRMVVVERDAPKTIKLHSEESPVGFDFWIQLLPVTESTCKMRLTIQADINAMMASMVKKPLQEGIERVADALQAVNYN